MLPNLKADVLGVTLRGGDSMGVLGPYIGSLGRGTGHVGLVNIVGDKNLVRSCGRPLNGLSVHMKKTGAGFKHNQ